jgi:hypothetical protein
MNDLREGILYRSLFINVSSRTNSEWQLNTETHIDDGKHVLEGGVGQQEEERSVDVHNSGLIVILVQINDTQNKSNHLK